MSMILVQNLLARYDRSRVFVVTELVVSGIQCNEHMYACILKSLDPPCVGFKRVFVVAEILALLSMILVRICWKGCSL